MFRILKIGSAFIGIIVGAGFASGNEIVQYFTSFGTLGTIAAILSTALFAYLGMTLTRLGSRTQTTSHKEVIYKISGPYLGLVVDAIIVFTLFGVGVVMLAGAGSVLNQQFGFEPYIGNLLMAVLVIGTVMMNVQRVIAVIGSITPFLVLTIILIGIYSIFTMDSSFAELSPIARDLDTTLPNWFISAINYVSFNIAVGAAMSLVMGGAEKDERTAALGGLVGGFGLGIMILISHLAIFSKVNVVSGYDMPMLKLVDDISPFLGIFMSVILFGMVFNTAVSMFYAFVARFTVMHTKKSDIMIVVTVTIGLVLSFIGGFQYLVSKVYPFIGYIGLFLIAALIYAPFKLAKDKRMEKVVVKKVTS
ncbi:hypothetical protein JSQ81_17030 [Sporosarcina sp. Marseille-Q4063]|uniref:YkvI family membrane protein n=1 Tax=Sporosarcina sp. Marseille-Q4063 TaxID=2810514 RepID=UPI001BAF96C7|nr:hypothetical protein [Sporosarcina sp. Marseille-Q4063]QUW21480.1 hypothetical protein JSQ81_17030 [Sporosarcina sp. Marseille-Q4063]